VESDFDFQLYILGSDFEFDAAVNDEFRLVYDCYEGDARPLGVWISHIVELDLSLILWNGFSFKSYCAGSRLSLFCSKAQIKRVWSAVKSKRKLFIIFLAFWNSPYVGWLRLVDNMNFVLSWLIRKLKPKICRAGRLGVWSNSMVVWSLRWLLSLFRFQLIARLVHGLYLNFLSVP
jgi:hypothetical protein